MTFLLFILIVLFLLFGWPMLRVWLALRNARNNVRDMFGGANPRSNSRQYSQRRGQDPQYRRPRRKIIDPNVGEYVEFEEITCTDQSQSSTNTQQRITYTESQITDVEWEDIK